LERDIWEEVTPDYYHERIAYIPRHMFFSIQAVAPGMVAAGGGAIVNLSSNSWREVAGSMPVYTSARRRSTA
jgi:D-xylose 1-dehydrogenase